MSNCRELQRPLSCPPNIWTSSPEHKVVIADYKYSACFAVLSPILPFCLWMLLRTFSSSLFVIAFTEALPPIENTEILTSTEKCPSCAPTHTSVCVCDRMCVRLSLAAVKRSSVALGGFLLMILTHLHTSFLLLYYFSHQFHCVPSTLCQRAQLHFNGAHWCVLIQEGSL